MGNDLSFGAVSLLGPVLGIWGLVGLVLYVWYLWALSKLFPYLGLPAAHGWIPIWNQWRLISRAGLPGWLAVLGIVPVLNIVTFVFSVIAIHRLNREFGKDAAYTVLGAFLPPIWAMLLASHIADGAYAGASVYTGGAAFPPLTAPPTPPAQGWTGSGVQAAWPAPGAAAAWPEPGAAATWPPPAPAQASAPPQAPAGAAAGAVLGTPPPVAPSAPVSHQGLPPVPPGAMRQHPPEAPVAPQAPAPQAPVASLGSAQPHELERDPHAMNDWGFSNTTEGNYERLAAEHLEARPAPPLGARQAPEPFTWPGDTQEPAAGGTPVVLPGPVSESAAPAAEVAAAPAAEVAAAPAAEVAAPGAEPAAPGPVAAPAVAPAAPAVPAAMPAAPAAVPATAAPAVSEPAPEPADIFLHDAGDAEDEADHTVIVARRARWGLELPDGETLELVGDDIVVGRKPAPIAEARTLLVADPTRTVSKSHARLRRDGDDWTIEDLHSTNGLSLVDGAGNLSQIPAGLAFPAAERMVLGTLEVRLYRL
ncbi:DUF5684 domain-containing protein [Leucobacter luti]|uniref:FHA domain-containing protein n=1 Tax=Leucobacter luti TaxID=340320 RepID=A0A4Q7TS18_9MICO|nr:DUF5684 domain-containing protein [Leucobacter luti]MBL3699772.1 FHA domain-containing protein [Leucobacter luti]RZT62907.1 FHA domain-containing protein [Leucobacter luti]